MALAEVMSEARTLSRAEQLQLIEELHAELQQSAEYAKFAEMLSGRKLAVWSPLAGPAAVEAMLTLLKATDLDSLSGSRESNSRGGTINGTLATKRQDPG